MTWDDLYNAAAEKGYGDIELKAKDEARHQVRNFVMELGALDPEEDECPEEVVESYCDLLKISFDTSGNIIGFKQPSYLGQPKDLILK